MQQPNLPVPKALTKRFCSFAGIDEEKSRDLLAIGNEKEGLAATSKAPMLAIEQTPAVVAPPSPKPAGDEKTRTRRI